MKELNRQEIIFALDIGTRSVIGIVGHQENELFHVAATAREEYKNRAVVDGQIEDIEETAKIAAVVKSRLEEQLGFSLKYVYLAAAGRVLKTVESTAEIEIPADMPVTHELISRLEFRAVQRAYELLGDDDSIEKESFFCVGHAVREYRLDGYPMAKLIDHRGGTAAVSQISTFLPHEVMESLYTTMTRIGLSVSGLTLEPIAAMNAIIPKDLRKLNLVLCDIGAGTSDIALCQNGSVSAYTMVTVAGDEITEEIMRACLVDFLDAEQIKLQLSGDPDLPIAYQNILGDTVSRSVAEINREIQPAVEKLAAAICQEVLRINGAAPAAVFLVGGGSQTPGLQACVAAQLAVDEKYVAVGSRRYMMRMVSGPQELFSPEYATPLGIAVTACDEQSRDAFAITINDKPLHLFNVWDHSALGVLQMAGYRYHQIVGRAGKAVTYSLNGERTMVHGGPSGTAVLRINGDAAALSDVVKPGDSVTFTPAADGEDARPTLADIMGDHRPIEVFIGGQPFRAGAEITVNGLCGQPSYCIQSGDQIECRVIATLGELCASASIAYEEKSIRVNGESACAEYLLQGGDRISFDGEQAPGPSDDGGEKPPETEETDEKNRAAEEAPAPAVHISLNERRLQLPLRADGMSYQFFDLLAYTDIDPQNPQGNIVQRLNGRCASYLDPIKDGDFVEIFWDGKHGGKA